MYRRGCLLIAAELVAQPDIFDALCDNFKIIRQLEADGGPFSPQDHILIVEHEKFIEVNEGDYLPFYDLTLERVGDEITVKEIALYIHSKYFLKCQNQQEAKKQETDDSPLIWLPDQ